MHTHARKLLELTDLLLVVWPCTSTSTAKLVKCVVSHSTSLSIFLVDTPSADQEFLFKNYLLILGSPIYILHSPTFLVAKKHILLNLQDL